MSKDEEYLIPERVNDLCADAGTLPALADDWAKIGDDAAMAALKAFQRRAPDILRRAADDLYESILYAAQDYLVENTTYNIASRIEAVSRQARLDRQRADRAESDRANLLHALVGLVGVINSAGLLNLSNGVQLGQTSWFVKATDWMDTAQRIIATVRDGGEAVHGQVVQPIRDEQP